MGLLEVGPGLMLILAFGNPFTLERYLAQPRYRGENLVLPQSNVLDFVDSPWEALTSLRSRWLGWGVGKWEGARGVVSMGIGVLI